MQDVYICDIGEMNEKRKQIFMRNIKDSRTQKLYYYFNGLREKKTLIAHNTIWTQR